VTFTMKAYLYTVAITMLVTATGCSKFSVPEVIGNWEAEDVRAHSLTLSIGPRLEISATEVYMPGLEVRLPIRAIERENRNEVTLRFPLVGWTVYFDSSDRMYMDVPFTGRLYYRRVTEVYTTAVASQAPSTAPAGVKAEALASAPSRAPAVVPAPSTAVVPAAAGSPQALEQASAFALQGDADGALRLLSGALQADTLTWAQIEGESRLTSLRQDVRYQALMGRYR
jgi:hypothetical protein